MINPEDLAKSGSESGHQCAVMCWANQNLVKYPELKWLFAIPNGGLRDKRTAAKLKAEGVKAGVPDLMLPLPRYQYAGLFIEMKKPNVGKTSEKQDDWIDFLVRSGYAVDVCFGWEAARDALVTYLE